MFNKIQKYLLLYHPLIWNIRLIPMIFIILLINGVIFISGYLATHIVFEKNHLDSIENIESLYPVCILPGLILLIGWLVIYNRNNAFKTFYPRKPRQVYLEWLLIFTVTASIACLPVSLNLGCIARWQSVASEKEAKEIISFLEQIKMLLPGKNDEYKYTYGKNHFKYTEVTDSLRNYQDILNEYSANFEKEPHQHFEYQVDDEREIVILKEYTALSYLYFSYEKDRTPIGYDFYKNEKGEYVKHTQITSFTPQTHKAIEDVLLVKKWLREGQKDSLLNLMDKLQLLHEKHGLPYSLDKEKWFEQIYRPPYFPYHHKKNMNQQYTVCYDELLRTYEEIVKFYNIGYDLSIVLLVCLCIALWNSAFIFSFRVTNGKAWLIALITSATLFLISCLTIVLTQFNDSHKLIIFLLILAWIILFVCLQVIIYKKAKTNNAKGKSYIFVNICLWFLPCLIPLFFMEYQFFWHLSYGHWFTNSDKDIANIFWINLAVNIIIMYPVARLVRKWKNTPDE